MLGLLMSGSVSAAGTTAFTGQWIGNDPAPPAGDGSVVNLEISGGSHPNIKFTDEFGTVCANVGSPVTEFRSNLTGVVDGDYLVASFRSAHCGPVPLTFLNGSSGEMTLLVLNDQGNDDPSDDTLDDGLVIWSRA